MALTGLQIYKLLPQTNCKECGFPTCLAFAMKLAQKGAELDACPYVTDEARRRSTPPRRRPSGWSPWAPASALRGRQRDGVFRHEKTFYHQPGLVVRLRSDDAELAALDGARRRLRGRARRHEAAPRRRGDRRRRRRGGGVRGGGGRRPRRRPGLPLVLLCSDAAALDAALRGGAAADKPLVGAGDGGELAGDGRDGRKARLPARGPRRRRRPRRPGRSCPNRCAAPGSRTSCSTPAPRAWPATSPPSPSCAAWPSRRTTGRSATRILAAARASSPLGELARAAQAIAKYAGVIVLDTLRPGDRLPAAHAAPEHLHRPAEADPGRARALRRSASPTPTARCSSPPTSRSPTSRCPARSRAAARRPGCWWPTPTACRC